MIYELAILARPELTDAEVANFNKNVLDIVRENGGDVAVQDDWGIKELAQKTDGGQKRGRYLYFIYKAPTAANSEVERRLGINEAVVKYIIVNLAKDEKLETIVKGYKTPYSKKYHGTVVIVDENGGDDTDLELDSRQDDRRGGERKRFAKKRNCWFTAKQISADWKDPNTYGWLISEFGKIAAARVSGVSTKHQRFVTTAVKRARHMNLASHLTSKMAQ